MLFCFAALFLLMLCFCRSDNLSSRPVTHKQQVVRADSVERRDTNGGYTISREYHLTSRPLSTLKRRLFRRVVDEDYMRQLQKYIDSDEPVQTPPKRQASRSGSWRAMLSNPSSFTSRDSASSSQSPKQSPQKPPRQGLNLPEPPNSARGVQRSAFFDLAQCVSRKPQEDEEKHPELARLSQSNPSMRQLSIQEEQCRRKLSETDPRVRRPSGSERRGRSSEPKSRQPSSAPGRPPRQVSRASSRGRSRDPSSELDPPSAE